MARSWFNNLFGDPFAFVRKGLEGIREGASNDPRSKRYTPPEETDYEQIMEDAQGEAGDKLAPIYDDIGEAKDLIAGFPGFTDWAEQQGITLGDYSAQQSGIDSLIQQLQNSDVAGGQEYAAQMGGFGSWDERQQYMQSLLDQKQAGAEGQEGLSDETYALRERAIRSNVAQQEARYQRMIQDTFANSGSTVRMLAVADEATRAIADSEIQQQAQLAMDEAAAQWQQYQSAVEQYNQMYQLGQMSASEYMSAKQQGLGQALQGYAVQIDAIYRQNQEYFQQYGADFDALNAQVNAMLNAAQLEAGLTLQEVELASELFAAEILPELTELQMKLLDQETSFGGDDIMELLGIAGQLIPLFL